MSSSHILRVVHTSRDFVCDIDAANKEIENSSDLQEIYVDAVQMKWFNGFLKQQGIPKEYGNILDEEKEQDINKILIANEDHKQYVFYTETYGLFQKDAADIIAKHTTSGKLVFSQRYEDPCSEDQIFIVEPGKARETTIAQYYKTL